LSPISKLEPVQSVDSVHTQQRGIRKMAKALYKRLKQ